MQITRRQLTLSALTTLYTGAWAQSGNLTVIVPQPAGGVTDVFTRAVAPALGRALGRTAVVDNVAGASGSLAANKLLSAPVDGGTVLVASSSETILNPLTVAAVKYKTSDFRLLGLINNSPLALYARHDLPANNLDELVALAKKSDKPLTYGSTGQGSMFHLVGEQLTTTTGIKALHVPYRGGMPMLTDLQGGTIDFTILTVDALLGSMVAGGKMKCIGVMSPKRLERFPNAATFLESKSAPNFGHPSIWLALMVPSSMPESLVATMHKAAVEALGNADVKKAIDAAGGSIPSTMSLAELTSYYQADAVKLQAVAKAANVMPQ